MASSSSLKPVADSERRSSADSSCSSSTTRAVCPTRDSYHQTVKIKLYSYNRDTHLFLITSVFSDSGRTTPWSFCSSTVSAEGPGEHDRRGRGDSHRTDHTRCLHGTKTISDTQGYAISREHTKGLALGVAPPQRRNRRLAVRAHRRRALAFLTSDPRLTTRCVRCLRRTPACRLW